MSALPDSEVVLPVSHLRRLSPAQYAALATSAAVLGLTTIWPSILSLWTMWLTDALKSIGMIIPAVSLVLILRAWRNLGWEAEGTWWGLPILLVTIAAAWMQQRAVLLFVISPRWATPLPPPSLELLAYGSGVVLLFGGTRLYRAALFPILLLWFANPVPHVFSLWVDLPLQSASAYIARAFAMHLGQQLTPDHLRLMFTPDFGMFIAPGCNGIRGSLTMGFIALIAGYIYRFRWYINASVVIGAVLLGYVFNLLRLCLLVLYYLVALHFTSLQNKAENADYLIGASLFLLATILLFTAIHHLRDTQKLKASETKGIPICDDGQATGPRIRYARLAAMTAIAVFGCVEFAQARTTTPLPNARVAVLAQQRFPQRVGTYTLVRSWNEALDTGPVVYVWAEYAAANGGTPISLGVSPLLGWQHDTLICHATRGEHPIWQGETTIATADAVPISFSSAFYNDGVTQDLEASTQCDGDSCGEFSTERTHLGFVYSRLDPGSLLSQGVQQSVPILVRAETLDMTLSPEAARQQLTQDLRTFLTSMKMYDLAKPYTP